MTDSMMSSSMSSSRNRSRISSSLICFGLLLVGLSQTRARVINRDQCCRYTSNFTVVNMPSTSDGRRMLLFCALDSEGVPNFDLGFLEQGIGTGKFTLSIFLRDPIRSSIVEELWSVNRGNTVGINSTLRFDVRNGLMLVNENQETVWEIKSENAVGFTLNCTLGNMILFDGNNKTVWQSFDHPTDTLLQEQTMTIGMKLISRRSASDPSEGSFSLVMENSGLALYDNRDPYWILAGGVANDTRAIFSTDCASNATIFDVGVLLINSNPPCNSSTTQFNSWPGMNKTRFMKLDENGKLQVYDWNMGNKLVDYAFIGDSTCSLPGSCGKFGVCQSSSGQCSCPLNSFTSTDKLDASKGCLLPRDEGALQCNDTDREMVKLASGITSVFNNYASTGSRMASGEACSSACLTNCSCRVAFFDNSTSSCFTYDDSFQSFQETQNAKLTGFIKLRKATKGSSLNKAAVAGGSIGCIAVVLGLALIVCKVANRKSRAQEEAELEEEAFLDSLPGLPPRYSIKALEVATDGFRKQLGQGGFGEVYFGKLPNGMQVAVKKLASAHQGKKEFRAEVATIGNIHHINLARLRGFCAEGSSKMLVYDYMVNGSLDKWLFGNKEDGSQQQVGLDWTTRFNIALGTARGLAYLHESCKERILHLDVKPQNILLDDIFCAKVSDFGLAKLIGNDETHVFTTMRGTPGYLAPEWLSSAISEKSDVFSFGIVLLELVSSRHNYRRSAEDALLSSWASSKLEQGKPLDVVDKSLLDVMDGKQKQQAQTVVLVALCCIQVEPDVRPTMSNVVLMLEGLLNVQKPPPLHSVDSQKFHDDLLSFVTSSSSSSTSYSSQLGRSKSRLLPR